MTASLDSMYQQIILDHYKHPQHRGLNDPFDAEVHHVNPTCGVRAKPGRPDRHRADRRTGVAQLKSGEETFKSIGCASVTCRSWGRSMGSIATCSCTT